MTSSLRLAVAAASIALALDAGCAREKPAPVAEPAPAPAPARQPELVYAKADAAFSPEQLGNALEALDRERTALLLKDLRGAVPHECGAATPSRLRLTIEKSFDGRCPGISRKRTAAIFSTLDFIQEGTGLADQDDSGWQLGAVTETRDGERCRLTFRAEKPLFKAVLKFELVEQKGGVSGVMRYSDQSVAADCGHGMTLAGTRTDGKR